MRQHNITLIPGDGVGPEVISSAVRCIEAAGVSVNWEERTAGENAETPFPADVVESVKKNMVALKGPITTPVGEGFRSVNVAMRKTLNLFANVRPVKSYEGAPAIYKNLDIVLIRENTEDLYCGIEFEKGRDDTQRLIRLVEETKKVELTPDTAVSLKVISEHASDRIVQFAFEYIKTNKRKKLTAVHKANILKFSDGVFLQAARKAAIRNPRIQFEDKMVDTMAMQLVQKPYDYDVVVLPNLYGDIISDLCAGLVGGLGFAPSGNFGFNRALFEPVHGSAPKYAGKDVINPCAAILSGVMMLRHIGEAHAAGLIEGSLVRVLKEGKCVTKDISDKNPVGTKRMTEEILKHIKKS